ncbi:MAG: hypothetical protein WCP09_03500 [Candidatus Taylorbacteria bacterium]
MSEYTQWYVYTGGDETLNIIVARQLEGRDISSKLICEDRIPRDLWPCSENEKDEFVRLRARDRLAIEFFVKTGPDGKICRHQVLRETVYQANRIVSARLRQMLQKRTGKRVVRKPGRSALADQAQMDLDLKSWR